MSKVDDSFTPPTIHVFRRQRVVLDADLAALYGVATKRLNEAIHRNEARFPTDFCFQLTDEEFARLRSQTATSKPGRGGRRYSPRVFTEHERLQPLLDPADDEDDDTPKRKIGFHSGNR